MSGGGGGFNPVAAITKPVANVWGDITGANRMADVQGRMADAQLAQQMGDRQLALQYAEPSAQEMQQIEQAIAFSKQDLARREKLIASSDPALIEAGQQALQLLQGKEAKTLDPLRNQRTNQRKALEQTLAQRLGPDYAQSSAGLMALNQFDQQTSDLLANQQQQSLGQLLGVAQNTQQFGSLNTGIQTALGIAGQRGSINSRLANAVSGNRIDASLMYGGEAAQAKANQQSMGQLIQGAGAAAGWLYGGGAGALAGMFAGKAATPAPAEPIAAAGGSYKDYGNMA